MCARIQPPERWPITYSANFRRESTSTIWENVKNEIAKHLSRRRKKIFNMGIKIQAKIHLQALFDDYKLAMKLSRGTSLKLKVTMIKLILLLLKLKHP